MQFNSVIRIRNLKIQDSSNKQVRIIEVLNDIKFITRTGNAFTLEESGLKKLREMLHDVV